jgi:hypothetical protein
MNGAQDVDDKKQVPFGFAQDDGRCFSFEEFQRAVV